MPSEGRAELAHPEAAGWLLGTLDPAETDVFRRHLPGCAHGQAAMTELAPVRRALRGLSPPVDPPSGLEARRRRCSRRGIRRVGRSAAARAPGPGLSFGLIHSRSLPFAGDRDPPVDADHGRWRTVVRSTPKHVKAQAFCEFKFHLHRR
jgi:anti-sigma factor RsiW